MHHPIYNSRDLRYKDPYGAVPSGTQVRFALRPERSQGVIRARMQVRWEFRDNEQQLLELFWSGVEDSCDRFCAVLDTTGYVGLVWYCFTLETIDGQQQQVKEHQLTVYDGSQSVPRWFGRGVSYQIFPDRFRRTRIPDPTGMVGGRWVHTDWEEEPEFRPDKKGEIRNRDFFGGDLAGITEKLDYLRDLGVETVYLCPIFEAAENHRYGTADYSRVDPMLGTNRDFRFLCEQLHRRGMRLMLDGVFNHTGFVSRYFNGDGFYPEPGACQSPDSPYRSWFQFRHWPDDYESWWGIYSLPAVQENDPGYRRFIFDSEDSVVRRWLRAGADGWRLDVADELPDDFVRGIHEAARAEKEDSVVIGEVWEDGSSKIAYNVRRRHLLGRHCDGLMNYPFRTALLDWLQGGDARQFMERMETLRENYPPFAFYSAMNALGTHDTLRVLTLLGTGSTFADKSKEWRAAYRMTAQERRRGKALLKLGAAVLFCFPGSPTVYYGDEAGMEGFEDPFNRRTFPWGKEDTELLDWFRSLGNLRRESPALREGDIRYLAAEGGLLAFTRSVRGQSILCVCNALSRPVQLPLEGKKPALLAGECEFGAGVLTLSGVSAAVLRLED